MLIEKVIENFKEGCLLNKTDPIIVGVSGGADSLCLLDHMDKAGYQPVICHFNHGIREESSAEAIYVEKLGLAKGIKVIRGGSSVLNHARSQSLSIEESARILRYKFLFKHAMRLNAHAVAVAHNADDQVETILMHLLRGTGLNGLVGMLFYELPNSWSHDIPLVRPLLDVSRVEIDTYCKENNIKTLLDRTNLDTRYLRNYFRHKIIPGMEEVIPGFSKRIGRTVEILQADQEVLNDLTEKEWDLLVQELGDNFICINLERFKGQLIGLQRRLIRRGIKEIIKNLKDIDYDIVDRICMYAYREGSGREVDVGQGLKVLKEEQRLFIARRASSLPTYFWPQIHTGVAIPIPGEIQLGPKWKLEVKRVEGVQQEMITVANNKDPKIAYLDPREEIKHLIIRNRKPGDRFQPLGMGGRSMKISDYMINQKIPRRARQQWPLVFLHGQIAWVVAKQLGNPYKVTPNTRWVLKLRLSVEN